MAKYRLKKKFRILFKVMFLIIVIGLLILPSISIKLKLIGSDEITIDYGDKYSEPGYKGTFLNKKITKKIKIEDNINKEPGKYTVTYKYKWLFYSKSLKRTVIVKDLSSPEITLKGEPQVSITIGDKYKEQGYTATDKLDGDLTDKVEVTNNINYSKIGKYEIEYKVKDSSGNEGKTKREITIDRKNPTQMSLEEYTLEGYFEETVLKETKTSDNYLKKVVFVGDSNIMNLVENGTVPYTNAWYLPCITSESYFKNKLNVSGQKLLLLDAVKQYKPEIMVLNLGVFSTNWIKKDVFLKKSNELLDKIKEYSPKTKVILSSIYPIRKGYNINSFSQKTINDYNYLILEMANKHKVKFLDVQTTLKDKDGYAKENYFVGDKFHFAAGGRQAYIEYVKTHEWRD